MHKPRVFIDADVIFAGAAAPSEQSASHVILRMAELTLLDCVTSQQAITEVERNLSEKLPSKLPEFRLLVSRCLRVVPDPAPGDLLAHAEESDPKDLPLLVTALQENCSHLVTFNVRHYFPRSNAIKVQKPGAFILTIRQLLGQLQE
jgi:predicted nucleic acid-binding protein